MNFAKDLEANNFYEDSLSLPFKSESSNDSNSLPQFTPSFPKMAEPQVISLLSDQSESQSSGSKKRYFQKKGHKKYKSKDQLSFLENRFAQLAHPNQIQLEEIASHCGLTYYQVYKWFWEKRRSLEVEENDKETEEGESSMADNLSGFEIRRLVEIIFPFEDEFTKEAAEVFRKLNPELYVIAFTNNEINCNKRFNFHLSRLKIWIETQLL